MTALRLSLDMIGTYETNCTHNLLLTISQVSSFQKVFENNSLGNKKLSKTQISKKIQSG